MNERLQNQNLPAQQHKMEQQAKPEGMNESNMSSFFNHPPSADPDNVVSRSSVQKFKEKTADAIPVEQELSPDLFESQEVDMEETNSSVQPGNREVSPDIFESQERDPSQLSNSLSEGEESSIELTINVNIRISFSVNDSSSSEESS
jgi:hypothetical protein